MFNDSKIHPFLKGLLVGSVLLFAAIGFLLTAGFFAIKFHLTNTAGKVDLNDRYFKNLARRRASGIVWEPQNGTGQVLLKLASLSSSHPENARLILAAFAQHQDPVLAESMLDALDPYLAKDTRYQARLGQVEALAWPEGPEGQPGSLFPWMNAEEWQTFRGGVQKDREVIYRAAQATELDPRLIVTMMVGEQIRLFSAQRESYKAYFAPLKILGNETKFSLGVCGIKDDTAKAIEANLKTPESPFYLGPRFAHLLDYPDGAGAGLGDLRYQRLTDPSHYYSYLYTGLFIRQILAQWKAAGYDLSGRPEILATLFNIGFPHSLPTPDPHVGGTAIAIGGRNYTFGSLAFEFYFSGDLGETFPYPVR